MSGKHVFRRNPAELYRALQVDEFAVRGSQASSTLGNVDFAKDFQGFWETLQRSRPELWTAGDGNGGVAVFARFSKGWRVIFTLARRSDVKLVDRGCAGNLDFAKDFQGFWETLQQVFFGLAKAALAPGFCMILDLSFLAGLQYMALESCVQGMLYENMKI